MATKYPAALDDNTNLPNPAAGNFQNNPDHASQHGNANDAIKALETKAGTGASAPTANTLLVGTGAGTSSWSQLTSAQLLAILTDETGTGSAVFANTPVLITPKVDTINENTPGNGVTVSGVNLKSGVITGSGAGLTTNTVPGAAVVNSSVDGTKINWGATGAGTGVWWEELGRVSGSGTGSLSIPTISAREFLQIRITEFITGTSSLSMRFNNDSAANYTYRQSVNAGADGTVTSGTSVGMGAGDVNPIGTIIIDVMNTAANEKYFNGMRIAGVNTGATVTPFSVSTRGKWANTAAQITRVDFLSTAVFTSASKMVILGHN
jgi:hypothetical protein